MIILNCGNRYFNRVLVFKMKINTSLLHISMNRITKFLRHGKYLIFSYYNVKMGKIKRSYNTLESLHLRKYLIQFQELSTFNHGSTATDLIYDILEQRLKKTAT